MTQTFRTRTLIAVLFSISSGSLMAQQRPYDNPPPVEPPYYRVRYEASQEEGGLIFPVAYTLWLPPDADTLRGVIVHQHGCGEGSCLSGQTGAFDLHWQALARKHDCALVSPCYEQPEGADCQMWCDPRNGSDAAFQRSLEDLGEECGHPELAEVPWALWGHSGGGHWAGGMVMLHPDRVAAAWLRSGVPLLEAVEGRAVQPHELPAEALHVPIMCNLGAAEGFTSNEGRFAGVWPSNKVFFETLRGTGAQIGVAVDPLTSHECGNQRYLAIPWLDAVLAARLPDVSGQPLRPMPEQDAWLTPLPTSDSEIIAPLPATGFEGELAMSIWLPNEAIASAWVQYVTDTSVIDTTPPPSAFNIQLNGGELTWEAIADLESGISHFVIECDGQVIATVPETPTNPYGRKVFQGLQYSDTPATPLIPMEYAIDTDESRDVSRYRVRLVNTIGLMSE